MPKITENQTFAWLYISCKLKDVLKLTAGIYLMDA